MDNKKTCEGCKFYREGMDIDYVPTKYCKLSNQINPKKCDKYDENYTIGDYIEEILPAVIMLILVGLVLFLLSFFTNI